MIFRVSFYTLFLTFLPSVLSSKILLVSVFGTKSTMNNLQVLADHLASRGHDIVYITREKLVKYPTPNISYVLIPDRTSQVMDVNELKFLFFDENIWSTYPLSWIVFLKMLVDQCSLAYQEGDLQSLVNYKGVVDLVIFDFYLQDCLLPLAHALGAPIVYIHGNVVDSALAYQMNVPLPYSYAKVFFYGMSEDKTFVDRLLNAYTSESSWYIQQYFMYEDARRLASEVMTNTANTLDIFKNGSVIMGSFDTVWNEARPMMPFTLDITAFQCRPSKPLHQDFEDAIAESGEDGFILFSMGTYFQSEYFSPESQAELFKAFSKLKQVVLWKNSPVENQPKNVKTFSWLPQQDLLGHPKAKLFISHCGMYSLQEAIYHGVPVLGIPIFADQEFNMKTLSNKGLGLIVDKTNITVKNLLETINILLSDKSFTKTAETYSWLLKDQPETPLERATYYIEYVIRHKDVSYLKGLSPKLNFFQYFCLDVLSCLLFFVILFSFGLYNVTSKIVFFFKQRK